MFYHQKDSDATDDLANPVTPWAQIMRSVDFNTIRICVSQYGFTPTAWSLSFYPGTCSMAFLVLLLIDFRIMTSLNIDDLLHSVLTPGLSPLTCAQYPNLSG